MWCKKRHKIIVNLLRPIFALFLRIKYGLKREKYPHIINGVDLRKSVMVLCNHSTTFDPFIVGLNFRQPQPVPH